MVRNVVVLGGHIQALGLVRQAKREGVSTILILKDRWSVAKYSRSVDKVVVSHDDTDLLSSIMAYADKDALLFPTSDEYVEFLASNYEKLKAKFILGIPEPKCVDTFADKRKTYMFCESNGIPHPDSHYPNSICDVEKIGDEIDYPVIIKPSIMYAFHEKFGKKAFLCKNKNELVERCLSIEKSGYSISGLVIQEYLSGGPSVLYSYGVFAFDGKPKAWIQANRIRQNPMDFGNSTTFAVSCDIIDIETCARAILEKVGYSGLAEIEFMYDGKTGQYKFLEINTRAWKWHSVSEAFGFGFFSEMIRYLNGGKSQFEKPLYTRAWVERLTDWAVIFKGLLKGNVGVKSVCKSYRIKKISAVWRWNDPLPAIMYILLSPIFYIKRH